MKTLIISFSLRQENRNYNLLLQRIYAYGNWAKLNESAYLIITSNSVVQVRNNLALALGPNDNLFVGFCPVPAAWKNLSDEVASWIVENQPKNS